MPPIKFCHDYEKKPVDGILIQVLKTHFDELSDEFIDYDTTYLTTPGCQDQYPLPKTDLLILLFSRQDSTLYTTIRRWTPKKEEYYRSQVGNKFNVVRTDLEK